MNLFPKLLNALTILQNRDNRIIDTMLEEFPDYTEKDFIRPSYDVKNMVESLMRHQEFDFHDVVINEEAIDDNGFKIEKDSIEFWVKFKNVKIRRRKIYKLGDYYLRLVNQGYGKWNYKFYTKLPIINNCMIEHKFVAAAHPHIMKGIPCMSDWQTPVKASLNGYSFISCFEKFRSYLHVWTYNSPHYQPENFEYSIRIASDELMADMFKEVEEENNTLLYEMPSSVVSEHTGITNGLSYINYSLPSARKKAYDTEPVSRVMLEYRQGRIYPLNEKSIRNGQNSNHRVTSAIYSLYHNFDSFCNKGDYYHLNENEKFAIAYKFVKTIYEKTTNDIEYIGGWDDEYDNKISKARNQVQHHFNRYFNQKQRSGYNDYFSFCPSRQELDDELRNQCLEIHRIVDNASLNLISFKEEVHYGSRINNSQFYKAWSDIFKDNYKFPDYVELLSFAENYKSDRMIINIEGKFNELYNIYLNNIDKYMYFFNLSYAKRYKDHLNYIEAHIEDYERNLITNKKESEANSGENETESTEENISSSETPINVVS